MQERKSLPEMQTPFVDILKPDAGYGFVVDSDRIKAETLYNALQCEVTRIKLLVAEMVLSTKFLADMQPYIDAQKPLIEAKELLMNDLNSKYKFYTPF